MLKLMMKALRPRPNSTAGKEADKPLPEIPSTAPTQGVAGDAQILERIRSHVRALSAPPPHLFRGFLLSAQERVYARKTELLREAAEIKRESEAAMMRILCTGLNYPALPSRNFTLLERLQQEE